MAVSVGAVPSVAPPTENVQISPTTTNPVTDSPGPAEKTKKKKHPWRWRFIKVFFLMFFGFLIARAVFVDDEPEIPAEKKRFCCAFPDDPKSPDDPKKKYFDCLENCGSVLGATAAADCPEGIAEECGRIEGANTALNTVSFFFCLVVMGLVMIYLLILGLGIGVGSFFEKVKDDKDEEGTADGKKKQAPALKPAVDNAENNTSNEEEADAYKENGAEE